MKKLFPELEPWQKDFTLLVCCGLVNGLGSSLFFLALPYYVYEITGQAYAAGAAFFVLTLPRVLFGSLGGVFADRSSRKRLIIVTNLASAIAFLPLLFVHSADSIWLIYIVVFLGYALGQFTAPAESAILPQLVGREKLVWANGILAISGSIVSLAGPVIGGFLLGIAGFSAVVLLNVISFLLAALLIAFMKPIPSTNVKNVNRTLWSQIVAPWYEWLDGLRYVQKDYNVKLIFILSGIIMIADGIYNSLWVVWVKNDLETTSFQFGLLGSVLGLGILLGGFVYVRLGNKLNTHIIWVSSLLTGILLIATYTFPILWLVIAFTTMRGVLAVGFYTGASTLLQQRAPDNYVGRILGSFSAFKAIMLLVGSTLAITVSDVVPVVIILNAAGLLWIVASLTVIALYRKRKAHDRKRLF
ncbi:MFS-type transporter involved in bile tolerance, Atg22 family [Paenibacillaceae bacterium GAS479]|nr:MFS-type transporter involved in bile tolerance, Atg22 family [Paenibacillaceae bacterium GAS479]